MPEYPLLPSEVRDGVPYWLLTVEWAGRTHIWSTDPVDVTTDDGTILPFRNALSVQVERVFDLFDLSPSGGITLDGLFFDEDVDVALLIEQGHRLERAPAELSIWVPGRTWEKRRVVFRGRVSLPDYGSADEPVAFTLEPETAEDLARIPATDAVLTTETWPSLYESAIGQVYPIVIGKPGFAVNASEIGINGGSPAYYVDTQKVLIAGHRVETANVRLLNKTDGNANTRAVTIETDALGRTIATAAAVGAGDASSDEYLVTWHAHDGGLPSQVYPGQCMEGAGEVLLWLLEQSTVTVDRQRFQAIRQELDAYKLAFCVNEPVSPWKFAVQHILPLLPISLLPGPDGYYPVLWRPNATASDAVASLVAGEGLVRVGSVQIDRSIIANEWRIEFAPRSDNGNPRKTRTITGRDVGADSGDIYAAAHLRASRLAYGELVADPIETRVVYDQATADRILAWKSRFHAFAIRSVQYANPTLEWSWLEPGTVVAITDSELHWTSKTAIVRGLSWNDMAPTLTLTLIDDPARDTRPVT